ncbi:ATP-binding protein [Streptomyces massasporeus]
MTHGHIPGRDFQLLLYVVGDTLRIEVTDTRGDRLPQPQRPAPTAESGRGLLLAEATVGPLGIIRGPRPRKTIWAELLIAPQIHPPPVGCAAQHVEIGRPPRP